MKNKKTLVVVLYLLITLASVSVQEAMVVHDSLATLRVIKYLEKILKKYRGEIGLYKDIIEIKDEYIRAMREIIFRSESLFNAVTYFPKTVPGQFDLNPYFFDRLQKNIWGELFKKDGRIEEQYPEIGDFSYITDNPLYQMRPRFREYADRVIKFKQEEKQELENEFGLIKYMKDFQQQRAELHDRFQGLIVPAYGSAAEEPDDEKVVGATKLYYAIGMAKLEVLKQQLEMLLMEKEIMEKLIKDEVNQVRKMNLYMKYFDFQDNEEE